MIYRGSTVINVDRQTLLESANDFLIISTFKCGKLIWQVSIYPMVQHQCLIQENVLFPYNHYQCPDMAKYGNSSNIDMFTNEYKFALLLLNIISVNVMDGKITISH